MNTTNDPSPRIKSFLQLERDLLDALSALQILHERLMDQLGTATYGVRPGLTDEDADATLYISRMALSHLRSALEPLPKAA